MQQGKLIIETPFIKVFLIEDEYVFLSKESKVGGGYENHDLKIRTSIHTASDVNVKEYVDIRNIYYFYGDKKNRDYVFEAIDVTGIKYMLKDLMDDFNKKT
jgi:hypothetical protein